MSPHFLYMLRRYRLAIAFWGLGMAVIAVLVVLMYESVADKQKAIERLMKGMPMIVKALAGDVGQFVTPVGWLHLKYFFVVPMSLGVFAVVTGSGVFVHDEEQGRLDLLMAYPLSRTRFFFSRCASLSVATLLIILIAWLGMAAALPYSVLELTALELALPFLTLFLIITFFQALGLCFSFLLPSRNIAAGAAGILLVVSFFLEVFVHVEPDLIKLARFFPLRYYQGGMAAHELDVSHLLVVLALTLTSLAAGWWLFLRREIRVMGEGSFALRR